MSRSTDAQVALLDATRELVAAIERDDAKALPDRIAHQLGCFEAFREEAGRTGVMTAPELAPIIESGEKALALAREHLVGVRKELERVRHARRVASGLRPSEPEARFISRRV